MQKAITLTYNLHKNRDELYYEIIVSTKNNIQSMFFVKRLYVDICTRIK